MTLSTGASGDAVKVILADREATLNQLGAWFVANGYGEAGTGGGSYTSPLTTNGDLFVRAGDADARLAIGAANTVLMSDGDAPGWVAPTALSAMTDTWSDSGTTYIGIGLDVSDSASASASLLMRLRRGGSNMFTVGKDGGAFSNGGYTAGSAAYVGSDAQIKVRSDGCLGIAGTSQYNTSAAKAVSLWREADGVWAVRGTSLSAPGAFNFLKFTSAPASPGTDSVNAYIKFDGSAKVQLILQKPNGTELVAFQEA